MRKLLLLFGVAAATLLGFFVSENFRSVSPTSANSFELKLTGKEYLLLSLSSELDSINSNLPKQIDPHTILNKVSIEGDTVINNHTIIGTSVSELTPESITKTLIPRLVRQICSDETKREFLDSDIDMSMDYYDQDQVLIFKVLVTSRDCK